MPFGMAYGASTSAGTIHLDNGARLNPGASLYSPNGSQAFAMQNDGNLVRYAPAISGIRPRPR